MNYIGQDEDILSYAMLPQVAEKFLMQSFIDRQKTSAENPPLSTKEIDSEVIAAISAAINKVSNREGKAYRITNISRLGNQQTQNR